MPKQVDHDQRRAELAQAVWRLIRRSGLGGVTIRALAEESGWSSGAVRHYLPSRAAILAFAAEQVSAQAEAQLRRLPLPGTPRENLLTFLEATLPLEPSSREWLEVWLAFVGAAVSDPDLADVQGLTYRDLHAALVEILSEFAGQGWTLSDPPAAAARDLQALLDGLSVHLLLDVLTPVQARSALERAVDRLSLAPPPAP
ncbi:TetR/AcrR family transcriptional regulator [Deinococcus sp. Marseille-Q6407]|uniref:TetR/AcrR family transcriptional regulator n=1 Tax=Deinococcus sp. Marseille-Q6407 TaxID=2969223 RepID=UPI0021C134B7|nr:TetR family transcriptional regulator C-terminal domain-containing protein [Deinococcus sp. Marseille-Q6407]